MRVEQINQANLGGLMQLSSGSPSVKIGLVDGPVFMSHPDFAHSNLTEVSSPDGACQPSNTSCIHGTFVAGILSARRGSEAPAICPACTLLIRPVFHGEGATSRQLADAVNDCIDSGAHVINLSLAIARPSIQAEAHLQEAFSRAVSRNVLIVAAAGNQGSLGSTVITRHSWIIPVVGSDRRGLPLSYSNLCRSIGKQGLSAPGESVTSLTPQGTSATFSGTSVATPFVTGTVALLMSVFPTATASEIKLALRPAQGSNSLVPPPLNAAAAYNSLQNTISGHNRRRS